MRALRPSCHLALFPATAPLLQCSTLCNTVGGEEEEAGAATLFVWTAISNANSRPCNRNRSNILLNFEQSFCLLTSQANRKQKIAPKRWFYDYELLYGMVCGYSAFAIRWRWPRNCMMAADHVERRHSRRRRKLRAPTPAGHFVLCPSFCLLHKFLLGPQQSRQHSRPTERQSRKLSPNTAD